MRKLYILAVLLLIGCVAQTVTHIPQEENFRGLDFSRFTERGFLITPEKYPGDYESIGLITYTYIPEVRYGSFKQSVSSSAVLKRWIITKNKDINAGLDTLYSFCKIMGADALINFKSIPAIRNYSFVYNPTTIEGFELSGFAIRRKE